MHSSTVAKAVVSRAQPRTTQPKHGSSSVKANVRPAVVRCAEKSATSVRFPVKMVFDPLMLTEHQRERSTQRYSNRTRLNVQSSSGLADDTQEGNRNSELNAYLRAPTGMAKLGGSMGGSAVLERSGLDLTQKEEVFDAKVDDGSGGGGMGKDLNNGGGGDGDDGDDDDYFDEEDDGDGDEDMFTRRTTIPELFDRASIDAVLQEWCKTLYNLPTAVRMAVEMGIISTAQLVSFVAMDARPTLIRAVARKTPQAFSREFVGRMMGDPAFLGKVAFEQLTTAAIGLTYEAQQRGNKFTKELDLVTVNVLGMMATNFALMWCLTPNRSVGNMHKYAWQRKLHELPNHAFDRSGPQRNFTYASRAAGVAVKAAQLSAVGCVVGGVTGAASNGLVALRQKDNPEYRSSLATTSVSTSASGNGAFAGLSGNARYQLVNGLDRYLGQTFNSLPLVLSASALVRIMNQLVGEPTRLYWAGLPMEAPKRAREVRKVVRRKKKSTTSATSTAKPEVSYSMSAAA
mmetsp:Transcript_11641/g.13836  ORF Transcript_11641/g.13836 Transcript_11641/m.13836 type:complete len:515 (-) Transcript_11641:216-1760(-)|eukprot:CAMPEP_0197862196 /NCGR_PEP_ID=MMETSP1438-20131217/38784_1 /TAXON_ID=1461541 /ORGANISM="Pterosperma sp., Strain CCMP1384" /LENGTH=514 /DNA_ID=CAMNT_0043479673 /DNA_START=346 /DNA_END=1890 /DNA_ORIENTATION=+